MILPETIQRT